MPLVTDAIADLSSDELRQLYEAIRARARYRFPIIEVLDRARTASNPLNEFSSAKGLVNLAIEVMKSWDENLAVGQEACLKFEHIAGFDLVGEIAWHLWPYLCLGLRIELPARLRQLDSAGRWDEQQREVLKAASEMMQYPDIWELNVFVGNMITALQAWKFADAEDLMVWDFAAALQALEAGAFSDSGESWRLNNITLWLNEDISSAEHPEDVTIADARRARDRFLTFRERCKAAGRDQDIIFSTDDTGAPVACIGAISSRNS